MRYTRRLSFKTFKRIQGSFKGADLLKEVVDACTQEPNVDIKEANAKQAVEHQCSVEMAEFDVTRDKNPLFKVTGQYMRMVPGEYFTHGWV